MIHDPKPATLLAATLAEIGRKERPRSAVKYARDAETLAKLAKRATRWALRECNEPTDPEKVEQAQRKIEKEAAEILMPYGVEAVSISAAGDPRGFTLTWIFPEGPNGRPGNSFGNPNEWGMS